MAMTRTEAPVSRLDLSADVDRRIREFFADRSADAAGYGREYEHLWHATARSATGGKRLRPMLVLEVHSAMRGTDQAGALDLAVAFELLHTGFLLHDDVIDGDEVRRGVPNVVGEFGTDARRQAIGEARAKQWGRTAAILAGDLLIHYSQSLVARLDVDYATRAALLDVLDHGVFVTAAGELADVSYSVGVSEARLTDVLTMTARKTAAYSFEAPIIAGAILAGADGATLAALAEYGRLLGLAFQLGDDLMGTFGVETATGKSVLGDLREGKETALIAYARDTDEWDRIDALLGNPDLEECDAAVLRELLDECGARQFVEELLGEYAADAAAALDAVSIPPDLASALLALARSCVGRTR